MTTPSASGPTSVVWPFPVRGLMAVPFPEPGATVLTAMAQLQLASENPPTDEDALAQLAALPRPWDPATCTGRLREELWTWLEQVAAWINTEHLWNVTRPGIPECWPAHPHLVHDLAAVGCSRYYTSYAVTPAALEDWHRNNLPAFLDRIRDRLDTGCQPGHHQPRPRLERDRSFGAPEIRRARALRYHDDVATDREES